MKALRAHAPHRPAAASRGGRSETPPLSFTRVAERIEKLARWVAVEGLARPDSADGLLSFSYIRRSFDADRKCIYSIICSSKRLPRSARLP
jgi:hypothetical protein